MSAPNSSNSNNAAAASTSQAGNEQTVQFSGELLQREVPCETKNGDIIRVKFALLLQSDIYKAMVTVSGIKKMKALKMILFCVYFQSLNMISPNANRDDLEFPVKNISTSTFEKIVEWLKEHDGKNNFFLI